MIRIPHTHHRIRLLGLGYGLLLFLWFSREDNAVWPVAVYGTGMSMLTVALFVMNKLGGKVVLARYVVPGAAAVGIMVGLGASIATTSLMFFKNALHAHLYVDYPPRLMLAMLERAPAWMLAGGLVGLAGALLWLAWRPLDSQGS